MTRDVFILQGEKSTVELAPLIAAAQEWRSRRAVHPDQIVPTLNGRKCHVGIVVFDETLGCSPSEFSDVAANSAMEWIAILRPHETHDPAVARALSSSFFDYLTVPLDRGRLLYSVGHAHGKAMLRQSAPPPITPSAARYGMIGDSPRMQALYGKLEKIMRTQAPVLITGESGVGKELVALAVHRGSTRKNGPFVPVNCGAIPEQLIGSLLFGHEKGAFTGAIAQKIGRFEMADKGTLFLDEVGDIPSALQSKLLRVLQEQEFERLGSCRTHKVDVRLVAATNRDLEGMVALNEFRSDLYYRLNVFPLLLPPLRERREDIPALVEHFVGIFSRRMRRPIHRVPPETLAAFSSYSWPGNIRELQNLVERAVILARDGVLPNPLPTAVVPIAPSPPTPTTSRDPEPGVPRTLRDSERALILQTLEATGWRIGGPKGAAVMLGLNRSTLMFRMRKLGIERPSGRPTPTSGFVSA
jgi:transcriptional regulator with GAF, ATPase, and Fis domain